MQARLEQQLEQAVGEVGRSEPELLL